MDTIAAIEKGIAAEAGKLMPFAERQVERIALGALIGSLQLVLDDLRARMAAL